tara:strand:+ start:170 stop:301 length:132 start_codon:yes stop_codon:yes gene_type:complete
MCVAEVLTMLGFSGVVALGPVFIVLLKPNEWAGDGPKAGRANP